MTGRGWSIAVSLLSIGPTVTLTSAQTTEYGPPLVITESFQVPAGLGLDTANGRVLIADTGHHRIKYATVASLGGSPTWSEFGFIASRADPAALNEPQGVADDAAGNVYVVNTFGNDVQLYRWNPGSGTYVYDPAFASTTRTSVAGTAIDRARRIMAASFQLARLAEANDRAQTADRRRAA